MAGLLKGIKAAFGDVEMAPYTIVAEHEVYEERLYPARRWACTTMKGIEQTSLVSPMFRALFNYISGKNLPNIRIDMTSPVTTYVVPGAGPTCESTFTMGFLVPEEQQSEPPAPPDKTIFIEERPELRVLTRRFGGFVTDEILIKEAKELAEAIQKNGEKGVNFDQYYTAGYDPPFKLFGRRNEIWFVKTIDPDTANGQVPTDTVSEQANGVVMNGDIVNKENEAESIERLGNGEIPKKDDNIVNGDN